MSSQKKVLILGAGHVSGPVVEYLCRDDKIRVSIASQYKEDLDRVTAANHRAEGILVDISQNEAEVGKLISDSDVVISLLPFTLHPVAAKLCIKHKVNMVTASYVSPEMKELHEAAEAAGIIILNEIGLDPGIDHMLAMNCFDKVKEKGGKIISYESWCGGLPAPEYSDTPLRYKFSWFPKGALMTLMRGGKYLEDGKVHTIEPGELLTKGVRELTFKPGFNLEGFPNRDSTPYAESYGIETANTFLRGTIRYKGYTAAAKALVDLGLLDSAPHPRLRNDGPDITWKAFICELIGKKPDIATHSLSEILFQKFGKSKEQVECITDLGLLEEQLVDKCDNPMDTLSKYVSKRLAYGEGERDLIIMHTIVGVEWPDGNREMRHLSLVVYGDPHGDSAMARTVGLPAAITTKMILDGEIQGKGMQLPLTSNIYRTGLALLKQEGIAARETIKKMLTE